jgi:Protein of unknown function (DUF732)
MPYLLVMHRSLSGGLAVLTLASAAFLGAAQAGADPAAETAYLGALRTAGVIPKFYTPEKALTSAESLCLIMDYGSDQLSVVDNVIADDRVPENVATFVVGTATVAFCPWNSRNR